MILLKCNQEEIIKNRKAISRAASRIGLRNDIMVSPLQGKDRMLRHTVQYAAFPVNLHKVSGYNTQDQKQPQSHPVNNLPGRDVV